MRRLPLLLLLLLHVHARNFKLCDGQDAMYNKQKDKGVEVYNNTRPVATIQNCTKISRLGELLPKLWVDHCGDEAIAFRWQGHMYIVDLRLTDRTKTRAIRECRHMTQGAHIITTSSHLRNIYERYACVHYQPDVAKPEKHQIFYFCTEDDPVQHQVVLFDKDASQDPFIAYNKVNRDCEQTISHVNYIKAFVVGAVAALVFNTIVAYFINYCYPPIAEIVENVIQEESMLPMQEDPQAGLPVQSDKVESLSDHDTPKPKKKKKGAKKKDKDGKKESQEKEKEKKDSIEEAPQQGLLHPATPVVPTTTQETPLTNTLTPIKTANMDKTQDERSAKAAPPPLATPTATPVVDKGKSSKSKGIKRTQSTSPPKKDQAGAAGGELKPKPQPSSSSHGPSHRDTQNAQPMEGGETNKPAKSTKTRTTPQ